ncbi:MAG: glycoside hydrolase [Anaerolineae bacterium]
MALKIAIIGGGSAYAPGLIQAFLQHADVFNGAEIALMDIAEKELSIVHRLAKRLAEAAHVDIHITATTNQKQAVADANFVLTTFRQGGFEARYLDESVPLEFGIIGQETIGPGGFFFAMRSLPVICSLVDDMKSLAPQAVLVNYTNPTQIVAEAVTHFSGVPCISICDQSLDDQRKILAALDLHPQVVEFESVGLNHATWSTRFQFDGEDGVAVMARNSDRVLARPDVTDRVKRQFRLTREYGRVPNSYLQYYYFREEVLAEALAAPKTRAQEILDSLPGYFRHYQEQSEAETPHLTHARGGSVFGDMAVEVLRSLIRGDHQIQTLNVPNRTALPGFASDRIVELPARLEHSSATPLVQESLPHEVMGLLSMLAEYQWLAADAIWNGDRGALDRALAANPLVVSLQMARRLLDAIIPLQREYLPERLQ